VDLTLDSLQVLSVVAQQIISIQKAVKAGLPYTLNPEPSTMNPQPSTINHKPQTTNHKP
jgi:hypothetical protein